MTNAPKKLEETSKPRTLINFFAFVAIGGLAAAINIVVRYLLSFLMPFEVAVVLAYSVGMVFAFVLFGTVLFTESRGTLSRRISRFIQVNLLGATLALLVSVFMARFALPAIGWTFHPLEVAHFFGVAAPVASSYMLHKRYTFV